MTWSEAKQIYRGRCESARLYHRLGVTTDSELRDRIVIAWAWLLDRVEDEARNDPFGFVGFGGF